jgi:error-prone DNA polymerase
MIEYAELHCHSHYSFLDAASSPEALVERAKALGLRGLALTDHDNLGGAVRFWNAGRKVDLRAILGAEITLEGGDHLTLLAENQRGYGNLCKLLTQAYLRDTPSDLAEWPGKGEPHVHWDELAAHTTGLLALSGCRRGAVAAAILAERPEQAREAAGRLHEVFGWGKVWIELQHHRHADDDWLVGELVQVAGALDLPVVATGDVHYATSAESRLRDAMVAIQRQQSIAEAQREGHLFPNNCYHLSEPLEMARTFGELPDALSNSVAIAERCQVSMDFSQQRMPAFPVPGGLSEFAYLYQLCHEGLPRRYPDLRSAVLQQLSHELSVIEGAQLAGYFLTVWDIVRFARETGVRCQGRGSAANSVVAYLLNITNVDPLAHNLLFERFLSADRFTIPDIDIDFAADRREEVIRYVYDRYGASHTAMVCNVNTFQARSAVRDLGKALDFPLQVIDRLAKSLDAHSCNSAADNLLAQLDVDAPDDHPLRIMAGLLRQINECPRHRSIHVGGMLVTALPLDEIVPLERATMPGRVVIQWNKEDVEDAGLIKIDLLGLRTLGLVTEALGYVEGPVDVDNLTLDDPLIYEDLRKADTIGAFQVESRAQQQMLPRLAPERFEDITIEVAIVRPGPIQGGAVHPYLKRRAGLEPVTYIHPCLEPVLKETLGVLLFQEQAIRVAMVAAKFAPGEADMLRRAMSRARSFEAMAEIRARFIRGAAQNGIDADTAGEIFKLMEGFAGYGFCKSHAASFALIAYQTMHLKRYHSAPFYCALFNQQPMGFYSTEVIAGDARRHGVEILPVEINQSMWKYTVAKKRHLRMGLVAVSGIGEQVWERIRIAREAGSFTGLPDLCMRTRLPSPLVSDLIRAGALDIFGARRQLLWELGEIDYRPEELPLEMPAVAVDLPALESLEQTQWEYELTGLSTRGQLMRHYRAALNRAGVLSSAEVKERARGRIVRVGGMVAVKQRPGTAKGIVFISLEDEFGMLDLVVKPDVYERYKSLLRGQTFILVEGEVQQGSGALSVLVSRALETPALRSASIIV